VPGRQERGDIEKPVPTTGPAEDTHAVTVFVERAQRVEFDDHTRTVVSPWRQRPTSLVHPVSLDGLTSPAATYGLYSLLAREVTAWVRLMQEGWFQDDYLILFAESEIEEASARYRLPEFLPAHQIIGILGWDDFLVRDTSERLWRIPTVPLDPRHLDPFEFAERPVGLEADARFTGQIKWHVKPLVFGGEPDADSSNLTWVSHELHGQLVVWWNQQYRRLKP